MTAAATVTAPALPERLARAITLGGPISIAQYMAAANAHYYVTRDPIGAGGDFVTAPEISQMFGELVGLWCADLWDRAGRPGAAWVELGPGRGTLAADARRAMAKAGFVPDVHFVETSPALRAAQATCVPEATWHDDLSTLPVDRPLIVVANEFFDALPIRQMIRGGDGWRERLVACQDTLFLPVAGKPVPDAILPDTLRDAPPGSVIETSPASVAVMRDLARRIAGQGGAALVVDYGYEGPAIGDTLQAVRAHAFANPFEDPGERDLTAHVDFGTLAAAAMTAGAVAHTLTDQGDWLRAMGIAARAAALTRTHPDRAGGHRGGRGAADRSGRDGAAVQGSGDHRARLARSVGMIKYTDGVPADGLELDAMARAIWIETFGHSAPPADIEQYLAGAYGPNGTLIRHLGDQTHSFRIARVDDRIVGYAKLSQPFVPEPELIIDALQLSQLYVVADWHGRGISEALLGWTIDTARDRGARSILLTVWEENARAIRFYDKRGFVHVGDYAFQTGTQTDRDLILRLTL